jgi:hypothetical protein
MLGALLWYHAAIFGSPFVSGYKFLNDASYQHWHQGGFLGIRLPDLRALVLSFFSPLRGLFALSPFLFVGFFGARDVRSKDRAFFVLLLAVVLTHTYFTSSFTYESWGWTVGPRHLTGILPFLMLPIALAFERFKTVAPVKAALIAGLSVSSVLAAVLAGFIIYVPDDVTSSIWALALPMLADGFFPVSWLAAWIPNPVSGGVLLLLLLALVAWLLTRFRTLGAAPFLLAAMIVAHFGALALLPKFGGPPNAAAYDQNAKNLLESVWLAPKGQQISFSGP